MLFAHHAAVLAITAAILSVPVPATDGQESDQRTHDAERRIAELQQEIAEVRSSEADSSTVRRLIAIDIELQTLVDTAQHPIEPSALVALAENRSDDALEYLRSVFETETKRRHDAAYAISLAALERPTNDQDWRYLIRSLTIVEGHQAVSVLKALSRFRLRANKPVWVREVILIALTLPEEDLPAALKLLTFWTGHTVPDAGTGREQLDAWREWFHRNHPGEPAPDLPVDAPGAKWTLATLEPILADLRQDDEAIASGQAAYIRATCAKCHRRGDVPGQPKDDRLGPDLTSLGWRRQPKEIVSAILYPSHRLNEEYPVSTILLKNGKSATGLFMADENGELKVVRSDGTELRFQRLDMEEVVPSSVSTMPSGLLEPLTPDEIRDLLAFLSVPIGERDVHSPDPQ